jgi:hypothetical protein
MDVLIVTVRVVEDEVVARAVELNAENNNV